MKKQESIVRLFNRLANLGFTYEESCQLRRIEMTLHRWSEQECGDGNDYCSWSIERDEETGKPFRVVHQNRSGGTVTRHAIADREGGALKRLVAIMAKHDGLHAYNQTDPRGCALYIVRDVDLGTTPIDQVYTRGIAVCY